MNLRELDQIEEGIVSSIRGMFNKQGSSFTKIQDIFVKDFVQDAFTSLNSAIKGGLLANPKNKDKQQPQSSAPVSENNTEYRALNSIFESIINLNEEDANYQMSFPDFMMNWFGQYMKGVPWENSKSLVQTHINNFEKTYPNTGPLKQLAQLGFALSRTGIPAGAPQEFKQFQNSNTQNVQQDVDSIKTAMAELAKTQPELYNKFIKTLQPVKNKLPTGAGITSGLAEQKNRKR
jgi:hypothetical protein